MSLSNMSLSSMKMSSMSIEYEQGNQVPRWGALDNIDIPARRSGFVKFPRSSFTLVVQLVQLGVFAFCIYAAMGM